MNESLTWILGVVQSVDPVFRIAFAGLGILLETSILVGLLVPGDSIVVVASTAIGNPVEYVATILVVIVGALAGESIGFALGRYFGPKIRASRLGRRIGERNWQRAENYLDRRGGIAVFLSRFLPIFHSLIPLTVGMSVMRYRKFMAWTIPACLIWAVAYVSVGWLAAGSYRHLSAQLHYAGFVFVAIIAAFAIGVLGVKLLLQHREERHMGHPGDDAAATGKPLPKTPQS